MDSFGKALIFLGIILILIGSAVILSPKIPFLGKLPGDIRVERENFSFYFPIASSLILSAVLSLILWLFQRK